MITSLCYRCVPHGEIIHTRINMLTCAVDYLPSTVYDRNYLYRDKDDWYNALNDRDDIASTMEAFLESDPNIWCVHVSNGCTYAIYGKGGALAIANTPEDLVDNGNAYRMMLPPFNHSNFKSIGYRLTKPMQMRYKSLVYNLTYDIVRNKVITNDGDLDLDFDVKSLSTPDRNCRGYRELVEKGAYAVVYINDEFVLLQKEGNKLVKM